MARLTYRPEIDGLRALAVLAVLFFHSHLRLPGGYVGVDIFFVISGYLITALIAADLATGTFSFRDFWERRIRRILPAASVTVVACLLLGFVLMLPTDFEELGRSAVAQALLAANVFFYQETGYFAGPAEAKPLLHFWSLAVEEQFYLLFPFYLVALHRWRPRAMFAGVASVAAASLALSLVGVFRFPDATFFLLPTRAWELALGALLALKGGRLPVPDSLRAPLGWMGMALMIAPMFLYDSETRFPGAAALPPCVGAVLVIWSTAAGSSALKALLSWRPVVFVGLISYSLYLWHWPVKVFSHYWFTGLLSPLPLRVGAVLVSFALAWLSWRYVELPFRSKRTLALPRLAGLAAAASVSILLAGAVVAWQEGVPERFPSRVVQYAAAYDDRPEAQEADLSVAAAEKGELRLLGDAPASAPSILLWGDSHARVVSPAVEAMCRDLRVRGFRASRSETASLLNWSEDAELRRYNDAILRWVEQHRPTVVVLASRWERVLRTRVDEESLSDTVQALQAAGVTVAIMRQVAAQRRDIPKSLALAALLGEAPEEVGIPVAQHARYTHRSNQIINRVLAAHPRTRVLDPIPYLSRNGRCVAENGGRPLYYDYQHLTRFGASFLRPMFASLMRSVGAGAPRSYRTSSFEHSATSTTAAESERPTRRMSTAPYRIAGFRASPGVTSQ